jgi:hypothetical protein
MTARLVALVAAIAAVAIGVHIYTLPDGLEAAGLRTDLVYLAVAIAVCIVALKLAPKKSR